MTPLVPEGAGVRRVFRRFVGFDVRTAIWLLTVTALVRVVLVLGANWSGSYGLVSVFFVVLAALPWIVLDRTGRRRIGLTRPRRLVPIVVAILSGAVVCGAVFALFTALYAHTIGNPFVYIASSYSAIPQPLTDSDRAIYFAIFAVVNMTFSPIGEEILYRGMSTEMLRTRLSAFSTALAEAAVFALVHLAHFGVVFTVSGWTFLPVPSVLWFVAMFLTALVFAAARHASGSLIGAILAHSAFNLTMTALIFFVLGTL